MGPKKTESIVDKEFDIFSVEFIQHRLAGITAFPESLIEDANLYFSIPDKKECTRIVLSGSTKCGKTTFVYHLSQIYACKYVRVAVGKINNIRLNKSFEENFQNYEKVLLHFPLNKVVENFTCSSDDCLPSKFVLIFEIDDHKSLNPAITELDYNLIFPCAKEEDRLKYLNHFIGGINLVAPLTVDTMKKYTPGYEIGHIKHLCQLLKTHGNATEEIFFNIVQSGKIKLNRPNSLMEGIGGHAQDSGINNLSLKLSITPVDDKIIHEHRFDDQLMAQVETVMKNAALKCITIGGRQCSGKTTLIKYISKIYRYGLVSLSPNYFRERNFNLEQLKNDLNHLFEENGRVMVHIVKENVPRDVLKQILLKFESDWLTRNILFVFERTTISAADVVIPRLSDGEILRLLQMSVFIDVDLSKFVCHTKEWTRQEFIDLATFRDSISTESDLLSKIDLLNLILKNLS